MLLFCDVDENGKIIEALLGANVIPDRQYDYFFFLKNEIEVSKYKIIDRQLVGVGGE